MVRACGIAEISLYDRGHGVACERDDVAVRAPVRVRDVEKMNVVASEIAEGTCDRLLGKTRCSASRAQEIDRYSGRKLVQTRKVFEQCDAYLPLLEVFPHIADAFDCLRKVHPCPLTVDCPDVAQFVRPICDWYGRIVNG